MKKRYAILVDSISTIGSNKNPNIEDVFVLPLGLTDFEGKYIDDVTSDITIEKLLESANKKQYYRTSSTKVGTFFDLVNKLLKDYEQVIYLAISSGLSSQYANFKKFIALDDDIKDKVMIVDTYGAGYSIEEMVYRVKKLIASNEIITLEGLEKIVQQENASCKEYIVCKNLLGANRGGRLAKGLIKVFDMLHKVPIIEFDKTNQLRTVCGSYDNAVKKIIHWIEQICKKENKVVDKICAVYIKDNEQYVRTKAAALAQYFNINPEEIVYRNLMFPVATHTLFDTFCFYFHFQHK